MPGNSGTAQPENNGKTAFHWGVATSAFQIEGNVENDMTAWEARGGFRQNGKDPKYEKAADHWNRWRTDFQLLGQLKVNAYRFSLEWSRIQPKPDVFDSNVLEVYGEMITDLKKRHITPFLTLHHFTHPSWFHDRCPWHKEESVEAYLSFVEKIAQRFGTEVDWYITFNEPQVWALAAYGDAKFPPGEKDLNKMMLALYHMLKAHRSAYQIIKKINPKAKIGIAKNFILFRALRKSNPLDKSLTRFVRYFYNRMFVEAFSTDRLEINFPLLISFKRDIDLNNLIDFWGINYYYRLHVHFRLSLGLPFDFKFIHRSGEGVSDMGWESHSNGLYKTAKWLAKKGKPIIITENGIATNDDRKRIEYLQNHMRIIRKIQKKGIDLRGYFYWSFLDNYEWLEGTSARFGLIGIDYQNDLARIEKPSAAFYREQITSLTK
jgi:beta-glucosidase